MSVFGGIVLTNKGRNLQAKAQVGTQLQFTRIAVGDGELQGSSILELNALKNEKKSLPINKLKVLAGIAVIGTILSNADITEGFYYREIGLFAQDPDIGEILYCYGNAGALAEYIPAGGGPDIIEKNIDIKALIENASDITAIINESLVYTTVEDFENHKTESLQVSESEPTQFDQSTIWFNVVDSANFELGGGGVSIQNATTSVKEPSSGYWFEPIS